MGEYFERRGADSTVKRQEATAVGSFVWPKRRNSIKVGRPALPTQCDRLAGNPDDPERVGEGVQWRDLDADAAIAACAREAQLNPGEPRFRYQLARAYQKRGRSGDDQQALNTAAQLLIPLVREGYVAAFDNLGWLYANRIWNGHNLTRALEVFNAAVERGSADAMHSIGAIYYCSIDPPQPGRALPWFERALRAGFERAQKSIEAIREGRPCRSQ